MVRRLVCAAVLALALPSVAGADPIEFHGSGFITKADGTDCPSVKQHYHLIYRIAFGDRPDSLFFSSDYFGREIRPIDRVTFARSGRAEYSEANGWGLWTGPIDYEDFSVTPSQNVARAATIRLRIVHTQPNLGCKITFDAALARLTPRR